MWKQENIILWGIESFELRSRWIRVFREKYRVLLGQRAKLSTTNFEDDQRSSEKFGEEDKIIPEEKDLIEYYVKTIDKHYKLLLDRILLEKNRSIYTQFDHLVYQDTEPIVPDIVTTTSSPMKSVQEVSHSRSRKRSESVSLSKSKKRRTGNSQHKKTVRHKMIPKPYGLRSMSKRNNNK